MIALNPLDITGQNAVRFRFLRNGVPSFTTAHALDESLSLMLSVDGSLGIFRPTFFLFPDGDEENAVTRRMTYEKTEGRRDIYSLSLPLDEATEEPALLFFRIRFSVGDAVLWLNSRNNADGILSYEQGEAFKLLVYDPAFQTPDWFKTAPMYHIFVDRFCRGTSPDGIAICPKEGAELCDDWEHGKPQYGEKPGDFCANNRHFGGNLWGVIEKLDYLSSLGVRTLYLSPVFDAYSNHKYDTGDYENVDRMFGGNEALTALIDACHARGMRLILDGVFNHTGDDSRYFNKYGRYPESGAYQSASSPYHDWYIFSSFPDEYESWWGIPILPKLNTRSPGVIGYLAGENGIAAKTVRRGIDGFRLDVADELPDVFLDTLCGSIRKAKDDALILGEVWENAVDKIAYGERRKYLRGNQLHGVMNYPIRTGILDYLLTGDTTVLYDTVCDIYGSCPPMAALSFMNLLGTHDTERILTVLACERYRGMTNDELASFRLTDDEYARGRQLLYLASVLQFTLPGVPSVFYGDEAGMQGGHDPFCRGTYPWGREDTAILTHYRRLGTIRARERALGFGSLAIEKAENGVFSFARCDDETGQKVLVIVNRSEKAHPLPQDGLFDLWHERMTGKSDVVPPDGFGIYRIK